MKRFLTVFFVSIIYFSSLSIGHAETLSIDSANIDINGTTSLDVMYSDGLFPCAGVNAKVVLPEGVTATGVAKGPLVSSSSFHLYYNLDVPSEPTVVIYSDTDTFVIPGVLFTLNLSAQNAPEGDYAVVFGENSTVSYLNSGHGLSSEDGAVSLTHTATSGMLRVLDDDTDHDGMSDTWELEYFGGLGRDGTGDYDSDGLADALEEDHGTNPANADSDNDGMMDGWEVAYLYDPLNPADGSLDSDDDTYTNTQESLAESDPRNEYSVPSVEDFETGILNDYRWETTGSSVWRVVTNAGINPDGTSSYLAQAPALSNSQDASLIIAMTCEGGIMSFGRRVNSESGGDYLHFYVDDMLMDSWSGNQDYARTGTYAIPEGRHSFRWEYAKNASGSTGSDTAWIDDIHFPESLDSDHDLMPDRFENSMGLNPAVNDGINDYDGDGFYNVIEYLEDTVVYSSSDYPLVPQVTETFETGNLAQSLMTWNTSGDGIWSVTNAASYSGKYSVQSPVMGHGQSASLSTIAFCDAGTVQFGLMTSTEAGHDYLSFSMDDVLIDSWSGQSGFILSDEYPVETGIHSFTWTYDKDASGTSGSDVVRVDQISFPGYLDSDTDGMADSWEIENSMNPMIDDSEGDANSNSISNIDEFNAALEPPDFTAPGPVGFSVNPTATGSGTITMTALTATDPEGNGVQYLFEETSGNPGATDSNWQDSPVYTDTGLDPDTIYTYRIKVRDLSATQNESDWSATRSAITENNDDVDPPTPNPAAFSSAPSATGTSSIAMTAVTASDPSGVQYYFEELSGNAGASSSGWQSSPSYTDTGLSVSTTYIYRVKVRDMSANQNETAWSNSVSETTDSDKGMCGARPIQNSNIQATPSALISMGKAFIPLVPAVIALLIWGIVRRRNPGRESMS